MTSSLKKISIICPVFNEEKAIPLFYGRIKDVIKSIPQIHFNLIFTNNNSTDGSLKQIHLLMKEDQNVYVLSLSKNFGYQASLLAGLRHAEGEAMIIIDVDCEDPPELIQDFVGHWQSGYDICYGIRGQRQESKYITIMRRLFYRILRITSDIDIVLDMAEFSLISSRVRDSIVKNSNTFPFIRAEIAYSGFPKKGIFYNRQKRIIGESKYNLWRMTLFAVAGILTVSTLPLRIPVYALPLVLLLHLAMLFPSFQNTIINFNSVVLLDLLFIILMVVGHGLYLARIYKNGIGRPVYIIDWNSSDSRLSGNSENT